MLKNVLKKFNRQPTLLGRCGRKNVLFKKETFCFCIVVSAVLVSSADSAISPSLCPCITSTDELALDTLLPRYGPLYGADIIGNTTGRPYGIGCYAHDLLRHFCFQANTVEGECQKVDGSIFPKPLKCLKRNLWCRAKWCYVNSDKCALKAFQAPEQSSNNTIGPLGFSALRTISYAACGSINTPTNGDSLRGNLVDKTLKVAILQNSGGWMGSYKSSKATSKYNGYYGPAVDLIESVQQEAGFRVDVEHALPPFAKAIANSSSKFTQCVTLVGLGYYDFCIGDFSITSARHLRTEFFTLENEGIYLISKVESVLDPSASLAFVFLPFQPKVWMGMACLILLYAVVGFLQEISYGRQIKERRGNARNSWVSGNTTIEKSQKCIALASLLCENVFFYFAFFFSNSEPNSRFDNPPISTKFTLVSLGWLITLSLAVYTGEAASLFAISRSAYEIESIEAAVIGGHVICCSRATATPVMELYPAAKLLPDSRDAKAGLIKRADIFKYMTSGQCAVGVITKQDLEAEHSASPPRHCNIHIVGDPITHVGRGVPIISKLHRELSWHLQLVKNKGLWKKTLNKWRPTPLCSGAREDTGEGLSLQQMSGLFLSSFTLFMVGVIIDLMLCCTKLKVVRESKIGRSINQSFKKLQPQIQLDRQDDGTIQMSQRTIQMSQRRL